jgi:hypothetical protein
MNASSQAGSQAASPGTPKPDGNCPEGDTVYRGGGFSPSDLKIRPGKMDCHFVHLYQIQFLKMYLANLNLSE